MKLFIFLSLLSTQAFAGESYEAYLSDNAEEGYSLIIARHNSPYSVLLDKCFKARVIGFNIARSNDPQSEYRPVVTCYDDENIKLSKGIKLELEECVDKRRESVYHQANCIQRKVILAHNALKPKQ